MSTYTKIKTLPLSLFNNAEYLSFMNHVLDLANGNSGGGDSESPDEISLLTGSDGIPELGLTKDKGPLAGFAQGREQAVRHHARPRRLPRRTGERE